MSIQICMYVYVYIYIYTHTYVYRAAAASQHCPTLAEPFAPSLRALPRLPICVRTCMHSYIYIYIYTHPRDVICYMLHVICYIILHPLLSRLISDKIKASKHISTYNECMNYTEHIDFSLTTRLASPPPSLKTDFGGTKPRKAQIHTINA